MKNNKPHFFYVLYSDETPVFEQSEGTQGLIYIITSIDSRVGFNNNYV